jgi:tripartite-type tricarboxylate transporter receptor subunit TctC
MKPIRRQFLRFAAGAAASRLFVEIAQAQTYPGRPVRIIVPFAAGNGPDIIARLMQHSLSHRLGQPFVIENRPGAGTNVGTEAVATAPPDGYTLLWTPTASAINATLYEDLHFNFIRDTTPVAGCVQLPNIMVVNPSLPAKTVPEFIAYAKTVPGKINYVSGGNGTTPHLTAELFKMMTNINITHVPYRSSTQALSDVMGGQAQMMFDAIATSIAHVKAGELRALGVTTAARSAVLPDVPSIGEFVQGYEANSWLGIVAPKGTPKDIVEKLNNEINAALADHEMKKQLSDIGTQPMPMMTPAEFGEFIVAETAKWGKVVKFAGIKVE